MATAAPLDRPLRFERIFLEKVWGGRALERAPGIALPPGVRVGETWEVVDRERERSRVAGGPLAGCSLEELVRERRRELLGGAPTNARGRFPLLVKLIDASQNLSVQVHPDDEAAARAGGGAEGKTEAWFVLAAEPGARVWAGLAPGVTRADVVARGSRAGAEELLAAHEVRPGDCITVHGGTVHAIGAGVTLLEVQQNSDTTYRLWDWGRTGLDGRPRETHVEQALRAIDFERPAPPPARRAADAPSGAWSRLSETRWFALDELELDGSLRQPADDSFAIYAVVRGRGRIECPGGEATLAPGDTWLVPAAAGAHRISSTGGALALVRLSSRP